MWAMGQPVPDNLTQLLPGISARAGQADRDGIWPQHDLRDLAHIGAERWAIPSEFGGDDLSAMDLHLRYEAIASASLATALVVSQRDAAAGFIEGAEPSPLRQALLRRMVGGSCFATIGIAQLTTSRQGGAPALIARPVGSDFVLNGVIPWSTGAGQSRFVIAGAALEEGSQILFALPTDLPGVVIQPPLPLVALRSSWTARIDCTDARLERRWILRGPMERVLSTRARGLPLGQSFLALGLCRAALDLIAAHQSESAQAVAGQYRSRLEELRALVIAACESAPLPPTAPIRGAVHDFAVRITHTAVALYKGSALLLDHPAQRLAREAMFLLVWSCPDSVIECTVQELAK